MRHLAHSRRNRNGLPYHRSNTRSSVAIEERYIGILEAAQDVFARRGFHQASIREIARTADLSLAGLYHYVGGKTSCCS
jgi:hypothetical protein